MQSLNQEQNPMDLKKGDATPVLENNCSTSASTKETKSYLHPRRVTQGGPEKPSTSSSNFSLKLANNLIVSKKA